jgi:hypothetical protein
MCQSGSPLTPPTAPLSVLLGCGCGAEARSRAGMKTGPRTRSQNKKGREDRRSRGAVHRAEQHRGREPPSPTDALSGQALRTPSLVRKDGGPGVKFTERPAQCPTPRVAPMARVDSVVRAGRPSLRHSVPIGTVTNGGARPTVCAVGGGKTQFFCARSLHSG